MPIQLTGRLAWLVLLSSLTGTGCGLFGDDTDREVPIPVLDGWYPKHQRITVGETATFHLDLEWPGGSQPDWVGIQTMFDSPTAPDPTKEVVYEPGRVTVHYTPTENGVTTIPGNNIYVFDTDNEYHLEVLEIPVTVSVTASPGGAVGSVHVPVEATTMVVGERRPMQAVAMALGAGGIPVMLGDEILYSSDDEAVFTVDAEGVITAVGPGRADFRAEVASGPQGVVDVTVIEGETGPPLPGTTLASFHPWSPPRTQHDDPGLPMDIMAVDSEGRPWFVMQAQQKPLYLVGWTGSGLGYERIGEWWETTENHFLGMGPDDHLYIGWQSDGWPGLVVVDRPADGALGDWQRRMLPITPYPDGDPEAEVHDRRTGRNVTVHHDYRIAVLPSETGLWVSYIYGGRMDVFGYATPEELESACHRSVRLAHLTPDSMTVEEVERVRFLKPPAIEPTPDDLCSPYYDWADYCWDWSEIANPRLSSSDLAPPEPHTGGKPVIVALEDDEMIEGSTGVAFVHQDGEWVREIEYPDAYQVFVAHNEHLDVPALRGPNPDAAHLSFGGAGGACWGTTTADGGALVGTQGVDTLRRESAYWDAEEGRHFRWDHLLDVWEGPRSDPSDEAWYGMSADAEHLFILTAHEPPEVTTAPSNQVWLYQARIPQLARHDGGESDGQRLFDGPTTVDARRLLTLDDGARILLIDVPEWSTGLEVGRGLADGEDIAYVGTAAGLEELAHDWVSWTDGESVYLARSGDGGRNIRVFRSRDAGSSWLLLGEAPFAGEVYQAVSVGGGRHFISAGSPGATGYALLHVVESGDAIAAVQVDDGSDGAYGFATGVYPEHVGLLAHGDEAVLILDTTSDTLHRLVTRVYDADGTRVMDHAVDTPGYKHPSVSAVTGSGVILIGSSDGGVQHLERSDDQGATWTASGLDLSLPWGGLSTLRMTTLADGRVVLTLPAGVEPNDMQQKVATTADGLSLTDWQKVRPQGGWGQTVIDLAPDPDGGLQILMTDAGTFSSDPPDSDVLVIRVDP